VNGLRWVGRDLLYSVRSLQRDRGSVSLALLALSLGIGAATVIFSVVYSVFIASFPYKDPSRVVHFFIQTPQSPGRSAWYPAREFDAFRTQNQVFSDVLAGASFEVLYTRDNVAYRARGAIIDPHAVRALGIRLVAGRDMSEADGAPEAPPTFYITERLWNAQFNRDPSVVGQHLTLNGVVRTLIGVLPRGFSLHAADVFFPTTVTATSTNRAIGGDGSQPLQVWAYARLKPGVTPDQAAANVSVIARNLTSLNPRRYPENLSVAIMSLAEVWTSDDLKEMLYILTGAVLMLLMIACSNVANLLLARSTAREAEFALRAGLGASRGRLVQQLLAESLVLATAGTAIGAALAVAGLRWVQAAIPPNYMPDDMAIRFSGPALLAAVGIALLTTILCGVAPAFRVARGNLYARLVGTGKGPSVRGGRGRIRSLLVAVQVTLAIVLLVGAVLMMRTLLALEHVTLGMDPNHVLVGRLAFPVDHPPTPEARAQFVRELAAKLEATPGVIAASPAVAYPLRQGPGSPVRVVGFESPPDAQAGMEFVGPHYFEAIRVPLVTGRLLSQGDVDGARSVVVVNETFVHQYLGNGNPIGRTVSFAAMDNRAGPGQALQFEIVGVVGDVRNTGGLEDPVRPQAYLPYTLPGLSAESLVIRTVGDPLTFQQTVSKQIWAVGSGVAFMNVMSLQEVLHRDALGQPRFGAGLLATFGAIGLILAAIGVFSVMTYTVSLETRNVGIRMALGAQPTGVLRMMVFRGLRPIVIGAVVGVGASYALSRVLSSQVFGITATDPWTFVLAVVVLVGTGAVACIVPARRAARIDPLVALREE
jgi:putative ABC transport system permease protein